jgi:hypothetical protein
LIKKTSEAVRENPEAVSELCLALQPMLTHPKDEIRLDAFYILCSVIEMDKFPAANTVLGLLDGKLHIACL